MKKMFVVCVIPPLFAGCGGGGGTADTVSPSQAPATSSQTTAAPASSMAPYVGTWVGDCQSRSRETIVSTVALDGTLITSAVLNYYANADCSGTIVGTDTYSENFISTYLNTVDATVSLSLSGATPAVSFKADRYTQTIAAHLVTRTGTGETGAGTQQAAHTFNGAAYIAGNDMYILEAQGDSLKFDSHYARKP